MIKPILYTLACGLLLTATSCDKVEDVYHYDQGPSINWSAVADSSSITLVERYWNEEAKYFNSGSDNTDTRFQYWPQAQAMDVIIDAYQRTADSRYSQLFPLWYEGIRIHNNNTYWNVFNDDMEWNALTMLRLYTITQEKKYLDTAIELWNWIQSGWNDTFAGGGIAWKSDQPWSKNACSNGPAALLAIRLYNITSDETYKAWAIRIYQWEREYLFDKATGAVYDNIDGRTGERSSLCLSYNQGTFVGAAHELYKVTHEANYLKDARKAAYFCISNASMIDVGNNVLRDEGAGDGGYFKGIFIRYFVKLLAEPDLDEAYRNKFTTFMTNNAETLWRRGTNKMDLLFGTSWTSPSAQANQLGAQTSACALIEAKAWLDRQ